MWNLTMRHGDIDRGLRERAVQLTSCRHPKSIQEEEELHPLPQAASYWLVEVPKPSQRGDKPD
jgi:hypothetical protein